MAGVTAFFACAAGLFIMLMLSEQCLLQIPAFWA
jgi:precorrin-2 methylase